MRGEVHLFTKQVEDVGYRVLIPDTSFLNTQLRIFFPDNDLFFRGGLSGARHLMTVISPACEDTVLPAVYDVQSFLRHRHVYLQSLADRMRIPEPMVPELKGYLHHLRTPYEFRSQAIGVAADEAAAIEADGIESILEHADRLMIPDSQEFHRARGLVKGYGLELRDFVHAKNLEGARSGQGMYAWFTLGDRDIDAVTTACIEEPESVLLTRDCDWPMLLWGALPFTNTELASNAASVGVVSEGRILRRSRRVATEYEKHLERVA